MEKNLYLTFKKAYLQLKILAEKSKSWKDVDIEKINNQITELDKSMELVEEKYKKQGCG